MNLQQRDYISFFDSTVSFYLYSNGLLAFFLASSITPLCTWWKAKRYHGQITSPSLFILSSEPICWAKEERAHMNMHRLQQEDLCQWCESKPLRHKSNESVKLSSLQASVHSFSMWQAFGTHQGRRLQGGRRRRNLHYMSPHQVMYCSSNQLCAEAHQWVEDKSNQVLRWEQTSPLSHTATKKRKRKAKNRKNWGVHTGWRTPYRNNLIVSPCLPFRPPSFVFSITAPECLYKIGMYKRQHTAHPPLHTNWPHLTEAGVKRKASRGRWRL